MTIYYWDQATTDARLLENPLINAAIQKLLTSDYNPNDLEKLHGLHGSIIYSFRLNNKERLLFTTRKHQSGANELLILEHLPTHNYHQSRYLKKGVLKKTLEVLENNENIPFEAIDQEKPTFQDIDRTKSPVRLNYFDHQFISLSDEQRVLLYAQLPLIITGVAGSGKTYTALSLFRHFIDSNPTHHKPLLYLTKNTELVEAIRATWEGFANEQELYRVNFMTYEEFAFGRRAIADNPCFLNWYEHLNMNHPIRAVSVNQAYQEFRTCSGFDRTNYLGLGVRQSIVHDLTERELWYDAYLRYVEYLCANEHIDPNVSAPTLDQENQYSLIVFDEAQLMSIKALKEAHRCAEHGNIVYCMDPHQNTEDAQATRSILTLAFHNQSVPINNVTLNKTHRTPPSVAKLVNTVIQMEYAITGGKIDKEEASEMAVASEETKGHILFIPHSNLTNETWLTDRAKTNHLAVIAPEQYTDEACRTFGTALVFTPQQIQGLGYHTIVLYKMLSNDASLAVLKRIHPKLKTFESDCSTSTNRAKKGQLDTGSSTWFRALYVALSRASDTLVWIEPTPTRTVQLFLNPIQRMIKQCNAIEPEKIPEALSTLPATNWDAEKERLKRGGHQTQLARLERPKQTERVEPLRPTNTNNTTSQHKAVTDKASSINKKSSSNMNNKGNHHKAPHKPTKPHKWINILKKFRHNLDYHDPHGGDICHLYDEVQRYPWLVNTTTENGETLLLLAITYGNESVFSDLLTNPDLQDSLNINHKQPESNKAALQFAVNFGRVNMVHRLLQDPRLSLDNEETDLFICACDRKNTDIIKLLLSNDKCSRFINETLQSQGQQTSFLAQAVANNLKEIVTLLLADARVDLARQNVDKAVVWALTLVKVGNEENNQILKALFKNTSIIDYLSAAIALRTLRYAAKHDDADLIQQLLQHPQMNPNEGTPVGISNPFNFEGSSTAIEINLKRTTAFDDACEQKSLKAIETLLNDARVLQAVLNDLYDSPKLFWLQKPLESIKVCLKNSALLNKILKSIIDKPTVLMTVFQNHPSVIIALLSHREAIFNYVSSSNAMNLSTHQHKDFLNNDVLSFDSNQQKPLQAILFRTNKQGTFFDASGVNSMLARLTKIANAVETTEQLDNDGEAFDLFEGL